MTRVLLTLSRPGPTQAWRRARYLEALHRAGAEVMCLFPGEEPPQDFDALCLSGGGDVNPARYGRPNERSMRIDDERDELELRLLDVALRRRAPVLGVCRGVQVLNVKLGGTLRQHVDGHDGTAVRHEVVVAPGTLLESACGRGPFRVNSWHHQGIHPSDLARDLRATVVVDDLIEAVELKAAHLGWLVGVQWHPERADEVAPPATRIFDAFVKAATP